MIRLALRVPAEHAELVLAELLELAPDGVEEVRLAPQEGRPLSSERAARGQAGEEIVEYAVYGAPGELPHLPDLQAAVAGVPIDVSTTDVADDWSERWKQFHRPVLVEAPDGAQDGARGRVARLYVRPPWCAPCDDDLAETHEIVIDPGQAFGTGAHATTHLCLELLLEAASADSWRGPVLDVGAGSGVLAIAAAKLGYEPVLALDNDRESIAAIAENAAVNGVDIDVRRFDLRREPLPLEASSLSAPLGGSALPSGETLVLANLLRPLLLSLASTIDGAPRHLIASGLLREEADEVAEAFSRRLSLRELARRERGEWAALWLAPC